MVPKHNIIVTVSRSAGFLAWLSADVEGSDAVHIHFDREEYDYSDNYNPSTGLYTVPHDGLYLIHSLVRGTNDQASHYITVDGVQVAYARGYVSGHGPQTASLSVALHLVSGQEIGVDPLFSGTVNGWRDDLKMCTYFWAILLFPD